MFKHCSLLSLVLPQTRVLSTPDEAKTTLIECYCAFCNHLIAISTDRAVLDIARQQHACVDHAI
jgi:hypothetical protein